MNSKMGQWCVSLCVLVYFYNSGVRASLYAPTLLHRGHAPPTGTDGKKSPNILLLLRFEPGLSGVSPTSLNATPHTWVLGQWSI